MGQRTTRSDFSRFKLRAIDAAGQKLSGSIPGFRVALMNQAADQAWRSQWQPINDREPPEGGWNWPERRRGCISGYADFGISVWDTDDRLAGLSIATTNNDAVKIVLVEGNPQPVHLLKGHVLLIILEVFAGYAQIIQRSELRAMEPANAKIIRLYVDGYGFKLGKNQQGTVYCTRKV